jgi:hypothetical protein
VRDEECHEISLGIEWSHEAETKHLLKRQKLAQLEHGGDSDDVHGELGMLGTKFLDTSFGEGCRLSVAHVERHGSTTSGWGPIVAESSREDESGGF